MMDVSKETNVRFLREAVKLLQEKLVAAQKENCELRAAKALDDELCKKLSEELLILRKKFFVGGREKLGPKSASARAAKKNLPHNRRPLSAPELEPNELEVEEIIHDAPGTTCDCTKTMSAMTGGFEESCEIHVTERKYVLRRHRRQKYVCKDCNKIVAAAGAPKLTPGGEFSIHMAVEVANDKFSLHLPLNRQAQQMAERGLKVDTKTLFSLTEHLQARLGAVPTLIKAEILAQPAVAIDETPMTLLSTATKGRVWSIANNHGAYYQYETTRSGKIAAELLSGYNGIAICDAYGGFDFLEKVDGIKLVHCWAHCRRYFYDATSDYPEAKEVVALIDALYEVEREAKDLDDLAVLRREKSRPIAVQLEAFLDSRRGRYLASGAFGKAVAYFSERREKFLRFLDDANVPLDSNSVERSLRAPVMGRNNFQGFRTINGADVGMTFYTIVASCKLLGLSPRTYMLVMATRAARGEAVKTPYQWGLELTELAKAGVPTEEMLRELH